MKKILVMLLAFILCFSFVACGGNTESQAPADEPNVDEPKDPKQLVMEAVAQVIESQDFADWQTMYTGFTGNEAKAPKVTAVSRYQIPDFEGVEMDCYLINVTADIGYWIDPVAVRGVALEDFLLFVDASGETVYDSISTKALEADHDTSTEEGRATYLMWLYDSTLRWDFDGYYLNDSEVLTEWTAEDLEAVNAGLGL